jgi:type VI secretion system protein ImpC
MFATARFAHYLKVIVRDWVGRYKEKEQLQRDLNNWIADYIDGDPVNSSEAAKCRRPLAGAAIKIQENEENPGYYQATIDLRPHFQLEGMDIGLRLVSRLKKA